MFEVRVGCFLLPLLNDLVFYCCQKKPQKTRVETALFWLTVSEAIQSVQQASGAEEARPGGRLYTAVSSPEAERKREVGAGYPTLEFTPVQRARLLL